MDNTSLEQFSLYDVFIRALALKTKSDSEDSLHTLVLMRSRGLRVILDRVKSQFDGDLLSDLSKFDQFADDWVTFSVRDTASSTWRKLIHCMEWLYAGEEPKPGFALFEGGKPSGAFDPDNTHEIFGKLR